MRKYKTIVNNPFRVGKDARGIIYFEELKNVGLVELVEDWVMMNKAASIMERGESRREDKPDKLLLVKEIKAKLIEIETLINKLEEIHLEE